MASFRIPSLLRVAEQKALSDITLSGRVLDLGGDARSAYQSLFKGDYTITTVNLNADAKPDILHDLEEPLPMEAKGYDGVLLINILEHIFNYRQLLTEAARVLKPSGTLVIVVPFLFPVHPSPSDYHRFTDAAPRKECALAGLEDIVITALGSGLFSARYLLLDRLLPLPLRAFGYLLVRPFALLGDWLLLSIARGTGRSYDAAHYALGYCVTARKQAHA